MNQRPIAQLDERQWFYILGARMRNQAEVRDEVLSRAGRYEVVHPKSTKGVLMELIQYTGKKHE